MDEYEKKNKLSGHVTPLMGGLSSCMRTAAGLKTTGENISGTWKVHCVLKKHPKINNVLKSVGGNTTESDYSCTLYKTRTKSTRSM